MAYSESEIFKMAEDLVARADEASKMAYAPYSHCSVGAALLCDDGSIYSGCNVENGSYSATICAERCAVFKAVSEGKKDFSAIAIVGRIDGKLDNIFPPCGMCRQVLSEFCDGDFKFILGHANGFEIHTFDELYPLRFDKSRM